MFKINDDQIKELESNFKTFASRAYPFATKATINGAAFKSRELAQENIRNNMVRRNQFTERSIRVEQTKTLNVNKQQSIMGSIADYMEDQEFGRTVTRKGSKGKPIATAYAAGQEGQQPRTKVPRKANKLASIQLKRNKQAGGSRKQRNLVAVKQAAASGSKFVFMDLGRRQGIFRILGGKKNPRVRMVWDLSRTTVVIPKNPTIGPAATATRRLMPELYRSALIAQAKRHGLFGF
jgi:hypothetical protein